MAFVAAMLVAFFGFFRKANVCPAQEGSNPVTDQSPCGASPAQIKEQGDWKSSAYLLYLEFDDPARARVAALMASSILLSTWRSPDHPFPQRHPPA
ncbi:hypothetical protein KFL_008940030 [Klebsormidium nitens]|uniref:Uncharacterized protein n=1 Tax=Klebsormidium nitens TaxID=105231 RepID=A0A1Y1IPE4_KLENI|nr:hypothetical protein KFL_008940030 [Klebsormidium nitens]|eukprot:GAQ91972.1 hypothetical protein KFL_008940030 [Klebsormidium nitens]